MGNSSEYFIGVEGGATHSKFLLLNKNGEILNSLPSEGLNCLLEGVEKSSKQIATKVKELAEKSNIELPVTALGLGLAGAENPDYNQRLINYIQSNYPGLANSIYLNADSVVSIAANFPIETSAIVLIAGTGSSSRLLLPNGEVLCCGGWGHIIGDYGSGYWIASRCIQRLFDYHDGLLETQMSVGKAEHALLTHFKLQNRLDILDVLYGGEFSKSKIASFCEPLAKLAQEGDEFSQENFYEAGRILGRHIVALRKRHLDYCKTTDTNINNDYVSVLAVGSLFESFDLLKQGFKEVFQQESSVIKSVKFFKPTLSPAVGSAILAAKKVGVQIEIEQRPFEICTFNF